ncbi:kinase-like domain-containing protein [Aspergillus nidulans var. acristatus]
MSQPVHNSYRGHKTYNKNTKPPYNPEYHMGHGALGSVDAVTDSTTAKLVLYALKTISLARSPKRRDSDCQSLQTELSKLASFEHGHIVRLIATYVHEDAYSPTFGIVTTPLAECDLEDYFGLFWNERGKKYHEESAGWFECLISGLEYLHNAGVVHGRINSRNILIQDGNVLFTDFGVERKYWETDSVCGPDRSTVDYSAPELWKCDHVGQTLTKAADVFSLAAVFLEILIIYCTPNALHSFRTRLAHAQNDNEHQAQGITNISSMTENQNQRPNQNLHLSYSAGATTILALRITRGTVIGSASPLSGEFNSVLDLCEEMMNPNPQSRPSAADLGWCWSYGHFLPASSCGVTHYPRYELPKTLAEPVVGTRIETGTASILEKTLEAHEWAKAKAVVWLNKVPLYDGRIILQMARERGDKEVLGFLERNLINNF